MLNITRKLLFGKTLFIAFTVTMILTILLVYVTGITSHRSIIDNSLWSLSILASGFFLFLLFGLYNGLNVLDNYGHKLELQWRALKKKGPEGDWIGDVASNIEVPDGGDGIEGIIVGIILWIIMTALMIILLVIFEAVVWLSVVFMIMSIYWIMIRALKLVFTKSGECENQLFKSSF